MTAHQSIVDLRARMQASIIGREQVVERLLIGEPAGGDFRDTPSALLVRGVTASLSRADGGGR